MQKSLEKTIVCVTQQLGRTERKNPISFPEAGFAEARFGAAAVDLQALEQFFSTLVLFHVVEAIVKKLHCRSIAQ